MSFQRITSRSNPRLKALRRQLKAGFGSTEFLVEGEKLIHEALAAGLQPRAIWAVEPPTMPFKGPVFLVPQAIYKQISPTKNGQPPLAEFDLPDLPSFSNASSLHGAWLLLDRIQDPGNAGTLMRAARAFGFEGVLWHVPTVFPFHHACIRASAGAVFHLNHRLLKAEKVAELKLPLIIGALEGQALETFQWPADSILAMGNEGHGFSPEIDAKASARVHIPVNPMTESLNVAGAGHILMYHRNRQRHS